VADLNAFRKDQIALEVYEACARRNAAEPRRTYLGMSQIGKLCERSLWLDFNGAERIPVEGRIARVFENGKSSEERIIADLKAAGFGIVDQQIEFSDFDGRFKGHGDGIIKGVTKKLHVLEIKTANDANFKAFKKLGIKHRPEYDAQVQCYMGYGQYERALFVVENKNNQELYTERVHFNPEQFQALKAKAHRIITTPEAPAKCVNESECRFCNFRLVCDNPPKARQPEAEKPCCKSCRYFSPSEYSANGVKEVVTTLRCLVRGLSHTEPNKREDRRKELFAALSQALSLRPDLKLPPELYYKPVPTLKERFEMILSHVLNEQNGWITYLSYIDEDYLMKGSYQACLADGDWCQKVKRKLRNPLAVCVEFDNGEAPC